MCQEDSDEFVRVRIFNGWRSGIRVISNLGSTRGEEMDGVFLHIENYITFFI